MRLIVVVLIGALLGGTATADERGDKARQAYDKGMAHFNLDEFDLAIGQFQEAYRNKPDPILLYNIAQAARLGKRLDMSIEYYEKFLYFAPKAANAASVQTQLEKLRKLKRAQTAAVEAQPRSTLPPGTKGKGKGKEVAPPEEEEFAPVRAEAEAPKVPPPEQVTPATTAAPLLVAAPPPPAKKPLLKQWWFWTAVGGGAAVLITGIGVGAGVAASGGPTLPPATFGPVSLEK